MLRPACDVRHAIVMHGGYKYIPHFHKITIKSLNRNMSIKLVIFIQEFVVISALIIIVIVVKRKLEKPWLSAGQLDKVTEEKLVLFVGRRLSHDLLRIAVD